ncbi:unnamed protein product, partial [Polarella glacialis]
AQLDLGDAVNAMADLAKAIELSHAQGARFAASTAYAAKADACVTLQCYDQAVNDCDEALKLAVNPLAMAIRGEAKLLSHCYREALVDCGDALALEPHDPYTLAIRAEAHLCLGEVLEAIDDCDQ